MDTSPQVLYLGRWVPKKHFRAFVYGHQGQKLVNSFEEYTNHLATGTWFATKESIPPSPDKVVDMQRGGKNRGRTK